MANHNHRFGKPPDLGGALNIAPITPPALDRFGQPIRKGTNVLYRPEIDMVFTVLDVQPVLDPRLPTGTVQVKIRGEATLMLQGNVPLGRFITLGVNPDVAEEPPVDPPLVQ